ncbi:MAG TPA: protein kinase [Candidatus Sulfopaludibacter sp.]|jgi:tetratricopeptide (TPR) repeat protein/predicted Ser/Thr protein kinase|nr:protein kinase [Candidatus Sulfopaludibacter sp.]
MVCPHCRTPNPEGTNICVQCSTPIELEDATLPFIPPDADATLAFDPDATQATAWSRPTSLNVETGGDGRMLQAGDVLGDRYEIVKLLGEGGMGAVYRARDRELDRLVAVKVIRPELARNAQVLQRFKQELILARQVTHRNIIRIFDLGSAQGTRFITMEYIEGEDLAGVLSHRGKLPAEEAAGIIAQVAQGLEAAHAEGVVHRDLKPQNIMMDPQGRALVMDFGIARSMDSSNMTRTGALMGTPTYMSPEQAQGQKVDARSDLYTLGIIFYELLTGNPPFEADHPMATLVKRIQERPKPPIEVEPTIPKPINDMVLKMLGTQPAERHQSATEILRDLDAWEAERTGRTPAGGTIVIAPAKRDITIKIAALAMVCLLSVVTWLYLRKPAAAPAATQMVSVLVADFHNGTGDAVFDGTLEPAVGLAMEGAAFISAYSRGEARKQANVLKPGATLDETMARQVALQQGISVVITGDIEKNGSGYKISLAALDGHSGKSLISKSANAGSKQDVLSAASKLATPIRKQLGDTTPEAKQLADAETYGASSPEAAQAYAKGQEFQWAGKLDDAIKQYQRAVELDPNMGRAYAGLAVVYIRQKNREESEKYFKLAIGKTDRMTDRERNRTFGAYHLSVLDYGKAIEELSSLIQKYPADDAGRTNLALAYFLSRNLPKAIEQQQKLVTEHPDNALYRGNLALYEMYGGQFDGAIKESERILKANPADPEALVAEALSQFGEEKLADATATYQKMAATNADNASVAAIGLADIAMYEGRNGDAVKILESGIQADLANKNGSAAAVKMAAMAAAQHKPQSVETADRAIKTDKGAAIPAGRVLAESGQEAKALDAAKTIALRPEPEPQAYAKLLEGEVQLAKGKPQDALRLFNEARHLADTWLGRLDSARASLELKQFPDALSDLDYCISHKGEAAAAFLDDTPTLRYFAPVYYYKGRAQEGLGSAEAAATYRQFVAIRGKADAGDSLLEDAQKRLKVLAVHP